MSRELGKRAWKKARTMMVRQEKDREYYKLHVHRQDNQRRDGSVVEETHWSIARKRGAAKASSIVLNSETDRHHVRSARGTGSQMMDFFAKKMAALFVTRLRKKHPGG